MAFLGAFLRVLPRLLPIVVLLLTGCGDLPEPFLGDPGATARRLAVPMTPMLAVPPPSNALLTPEATHDFADLLAVTLQNEDVPTLARAPHKTDWRLGISAARRGDQVVPRYAILDPSGHEQGAIDGGPEPAAGWTSGTSAVLGAAAHDAVPKILALMMSIRATRDRANPNSLLNRTAVLFVPEVTGAPGDGDTALTRLVRADLAQFGPLVQVTPEGADFTVQGTVVVSPLPKSRQQVEIAWTVTRPSGVVVGKVSQLNAVPSGTLDMYWGDVAGAAAQEASGGINQVVERFIGRDAPAGAATAASVATPAAAPVGVPGAVPGAAATSVATPGAAATSAVTPAGAAASVATPAGAAAIARPNPVPAPGAGFAPAGAPVPAAGPAPGATPPAAGMPGGAGTAAAKTIGTAPVSAGPPAVKSANGTAVAGKSTASARATPGKPAARRPKAATAGARANSANPAPN